MPHMYICHLVKHKCYWARMIKIWPKLPSLMVTFNFVENDHMQLKFAVFFSSLYDFSNSAEGLLALLVTVGILCNLTTWKKAPVRKLDYLFAQCMTNNTLHICNGLSPLSFETNSAPAQSGLTLIIAWTCFSHKWKKQKQKTSKVQLVTVTGF